MQCLQEGALHILRVSHALSDTGMQTPCVLTKQSLGSDLPRQTSTEVHCRGAMLHVGFYGMAGL